MYNLRYHIASLVAVFFALALGLLLGTVVAERGMIDQQGVEIVQELQARFDEISAENEALSRGLERDRAFAEDAVGPLVDGLLRDTDVVVLATAGQAHSVEGIRDAVRSAGGAAYVVTLNTPALGLDQTEPEGLAGLLFGQGIEIAEPGEALQEQVAELLYAEWRAGGERPLTELLVSTGRMATESLTGTFTVDAMVIAGTGSEGCDPFSLSLARRGVADGAYAAAAELSETPDGVAAVCAAEGLSAVDHLETPQGRFSLVYLLAGKATGYYGTGEGSDGYYPAISPSE
jgi:hypothetical protein